MKKTKHVSLMPLVSAFLVSILLMIIYAARGIYPFGTRNVAYYDMAQSIIPLYYHTYDVLHGTEAVFWDWYSGLGVFVTDTAGNFIFSPFNLFFYFVKREMLLQSMSYFLILKVAFCAGVMTFFTKSRFKEIDNVWHVVFGIIYATSGFAIQYYTSIYYLDIVILFPLIIYALEELFDNDKKIGFVITMAIGFILSLYLMYMVCFFLLLFSFVRVREMPLEKRQIKVAQLGLSVLIAGCLSAFVSVPSTIQLLSSQRATVAQNLSEISILSAYLDMFFGNKLFMLYGVELPLAYIIIKILLDRETVKSNLGYLLLGVMLVIPIKFEYINLAWHPGGYVQFPMRYGYMITFWFVYLMARILASSAEIEWKSSRTQKVMYYLRLLTYAAVPFVAFVIFNYFQLFREYGTRDTSAFTTYKSTLLIICGVYILMLATVKGKAMQYLCIVLLLVQFVAGWNGIVAPDNMTLPECTDSIIVNSEKINKVREYTDQDRVSRIKDISNSLNANYPFILRKAAISNWTFGSKPAVRSFLTAVGYSENYNRLLDNGGTIFTDSLLGVKEIVTREEPDAMLYDTDTYIDNEYYIAKMKKAFPFGIVTAGDSIKDLEIDIIDSFANINLLYQRLTGSQEILIKSYELVDCQVEELEGYSLFHYSMDIDVNKESMLYVQIPDQNQRYMIYLNDEVMTLPALENESNQFFPDYFVTGLVSCGAHKEETVKVDIVCASEPETFASVGVLNLGLMYEAVDVQNKYGREVDAGKNNLHYNIDVDKDDQYLMIPISYDGGYRVVRNGVTIEAETAINGAFIYIPLVRGTNDIEIKFYPTGLFAGCLISLGGALLAVLYIVFARKLDKCKYINSFAYYSFWICTAGMFAYIYVWQFFKTIVLYAKVFKYLYSL